MLLLMVVLRKARTNESSNFFPDAITLVCNAAGLVTRDLEREFDIIFYIGELGRLRHRLNYFGCFVMDMDKKEK